MGNGLRIGRIAGTPISVNGGLAVLAALFVVTLAVQGFPQLDASASMTIRFVVASVTVVAFLASILAHELGHASVAKRQGVGVLGITLSLLGGYAQLDRQAPSPRAEFMIAAAGPVVNLAIGGALSVVAYALHRLDLVGNLLLGALVWLAGVNIVLAALNLFPAAPLDGGRVLTAALWKRLADAERARIISGRAGLILGAVLLLVGFGQLLTSRLDGLITLVVGLFLFNGARGEITGAAIRRRLQRTTVDQLMVGDPPPVSDSLTVDQLASFAGPARADVVFPVVRWSADPIGYIAPSAGSTLAGPARSWTRVHELMRSTAKVNRAWTTEAIDAVLDRVDQPGEVLVVVHEPHGGRVVGTLGGNQISHLLVPPDLWGRERPPGQRKVPAIAGVATRSLVGGDAGITAREPRQTETKPS